ncbi:P-loop containing nucleoside triphosphate hydrolase protein [Mycena amicta]|nr:P-loop containing nucleoside triphosphate hydrolase protein [Mycena amicta]
MLPPCPQIFHGREEEVEKIMSTLRQTTAARIAILGTGGIGKTTLASSVIHHPEIASLFPGDQVYFVPCEGAPTAEELLATIAAHIGIERNSQIRRVLQCLDYMKALLVLDNFETPWEALGERTGVSKLLGQLAELKNLAIIITMRGAERPTGVKWTRPFLPLLLPISDDAALKTFLDIAGDPQEDEKSSVYDLLECTGNLPLAITLISSAAADEGCAATLARWHDTKTLVLSDGYDKRSSLDISISLSLTSAQMTKEALELLSLLAILTDGLGNAELTEALRGVMPNILGVKAVLLQTALAFIDASDRRLKLLVPIREYIAASHPPPAQLKAATWIYFQKLLSLWNDFDSVKLSAFLTSQITANVQNLIILTMGEMDAEESKETEREADVLRAALWIDEFLFVSNHSKAAPWASSMREQIQPWRHHPVYIPYLDVVIQGKQYSEAEMDELITEGNEYFQDKAVSERGEQSFVAPVID